EVRREDQTDDAPPLLVSLVRGDDQLKESLSTVDNLNRLSGRVATVLATVGAAPGSPVIGHYGSGDGASDWLPPAAGDGGTGARPGTGPPAAAAGGPPRRRGGGGGGAP